MSVAEVDPQNLSNKSNDSEKLGDETLLMWQSVFNTETTKEETHFETREEKYESVYESEWEIQSWTTRH